MEINVITIADTGQIEMDTLNSLTKESAARDWRPIVFPEYEELEPPKSLDTFSHVDGWLALIKNELYSIPAVEDIFVSIEGSDVDVWVLIPERDLATLHQIVEIEWKLLGVLNLGENPPFLVDFHVIYRYGRSLEDLAPTRAIRLPREV